MGEQTEPDNRKIYAQNYSGREMDLSKTLSGYELEMYNLRIDAVSKYSVGADVLDLCCGTGTFVRKVYGKARSVTGLDFTHKFLQDLSKFVADEGVKNVVVVEGDASTMPLRSNFYHFVYCFTSMYYIERQDLTVREVSRVLKSGGLAVLEFGNRSSLNTLITNEEHQTSGWAKSRNIPYSQIGKILQQADLKVVKWRSFQVLPMLTVPKRYRFLYPLLTPHWRKILGVKFFGRMLDEWISSLPLLRRFAFRHFVVVKKADS